jgi:hypothetical protein
MATNQLGTAAIMVSEPRAFDAKGLLICNANENCADQGEKTYNSSGNSIYGSSTGSSQTVVAVVASLTVLVSFICATVCVRGKIRKRTLPRFGGFGLTKWFNLKSATASKISCFLIQVKRHQAIKPDALRFELQESPPSCLFEGSTSDFSQQAMTSGSVANNILEKQPAARAFPVAHTPQRLGNHHGTGLILSSVKSRPNKLTARGKSGAGVASVSSSLVFATRSCLSPDPFWSAKNVDWLATTSGMTIENDPHYSLNAANAMINLDRALQQQPGIPQDLVPHFLRQAASAAITASPASNYLVQPSTSAATSANVLTFRTPPPAWRSRVLSAEHDESRTMLSPILGVMQSRLRVSLSEPPPKTSAVLLARPGTVQRRNKELTPRLFQTKWQKSKLGSPREILLTHSPRGAAASRSSMEGVLPVLFDYLSEATPEPAPAQQSVSEVGSARSFISPPGCAPSRPQRANTEPAGPSVSSRVHQQQADLSLPTNAVVVLPVTRPQRLTSISQPRFTAPPQQSPTMRAYLANVGSASVVFSDLVLETKQQHQKEQPNQQEEEQVLQRQVQLTK